MLSVRLHGRGGQGVVTAAEVLSVAAFDDGAHAQAFPTFGSERLAATFAGAGPGTTVLLNAPRRPEHVPGAAVHAFPATAIAGSTP